MKSTGAHVAVSISGGANPQLCHRAWNCGLVGERQVLDFTKHCDWAKMHLLYLSCAPGSDSE